MPPNQKYFISECIYSYRSRRTVVFPGSSGVKNPPADAGDIGDTGSNPGSERFSEGRNGNPLQYSFLQNPVDRGAW